MATFERVNKGDVITADLLNRITAELQRLGNLTGYPPIFVADGPEGQAIAFSADLERNAIVQITAAATKGGTYHGKKGVFKTSALFDPGASGALTMTDYFDVPSSEDFTFRNLAEADSSGHALAVDGSVWVFAAITGVDDDGKALGDGTVGGDTLPAPTALYQVLQCTAYTNATTYTLGFDWVRAHS